MSTDSLYILQESNEKEQIELKQMCETAIVYLASH